MKKILAILLLTTFSCLGASAQQRGTLTATLVDDSNGEAIPGAVVELVSVGNPNQKVYGTSVYNGKISVAAAYGFYDLKITFLGYKNVEKRVNINKATLELGKLEMKLDSKRIDDVVLEAVSMRTSQKGDTLIYNADAFKVTKDADAEGLLSKMPGVNIVDGQVEAQGETVKKVFVDGKEFFGDDVTATIKNLPAEVISKIEIYNKLSDQAEFTGVDDGEGYKAINIVTNPSMRTGAFGKMYAGYGFNDKYMAGGTVNMFTEKHRFTVIGLYNNVNQQNFATEDILDAMGSQSGGYSSRGGGYVRGGNSGGFLSTPQGGLTTVGSLGLNYTGQWGKKIDFQGSYFFNANRNEQDKTTEGQRFIDDDKIRYSNTTSNSLSHNYNHRFEGKLDYKINDKNSIRIRPRLSFQNYDSEGERNGRDYFDIGNPLTSTRRLTSADNDGYNLSLGVHYRTKFDKPGRTLTLEASGTLTKNDRNSISDALTHTFGADKDSIINQNIINNSSGYRLGGSIVYTEPLSPQSQLTMQYRMRYNYSDADKKSYLWDVLNNMYGPDFDPELSNIYNSGYITHSVGPGYRLGNEKTMFVANVNYQRSTLDGDQDFPLDVKTKASFDNIVYFTMLNINFNKTNSLRIHLRSNTSNPSVRKLQNVIDVSNPQSVSAGNPALDPSYSHNLRAMYNLSSIAKGRSFMFAVNFENRTNYIADSLAIPNEGESLPIRDHNGQMITLEPNAQFTRPINLDGFWNVNSSVSFGTPMAFIKSNLNVNAGLTYGKSPSYFNDRKNLSTNIFYNGGLTLGSNISDRIDFTIRYNAGYNVSKNSVRDNDNTYWTQAANLKFKWVAWAGFTLSGSANYSMYEGITDNFNEEYLICNLYLGKKMLKNQRGELIFGVNDMLDQNTSFSRNIRDNYIENVTTNTIGRYFGLQFIYNLRSFAGKSVQPRSREFDSIGPGPRQGPPSGRGFGPPNRF